MSVNTASALCTRRTATQVPSRIKISKQSKDINPRSTARNASHPRPASGDGFPGKRTKSRWRQKLIKIQNPSHHQNPACEQRFSQGLGAHPWIARAEEIHRGRRGSAAEPGGGFAGAVRLRSRRRVASARSGVWCGGDRVAASPVVW